MKLARRKFLHAAAGIAVLPALPRTAAAQSYPSKPVRVIVPFPPAGPSDITARLLGQALSERWGQSVVIENRAGATGNLGSALAARAQPDGHTILISTTAYLVNVATFKRPGYSLSDFRSVAVIGGGPQVLIAAPNLRHRSVRDIIGASRSEPLSFGSTGAGSSTHLIGEFIFRVLGQADITHVPFGGAGPLVNSVSGGHVPIGMLAMSGAIQPARAGLVRLIAVTSANRLPAFPDLPTINEAGLGNVENDSIVAILLPVHTPISIANKIGDDVRAVIQTEGVKKGLALAGLGALHLGLAEADAFVRDEAKRWEFIARKVGLSLE